MSEEPIENGGKRNEDGTFAPGNPGGPGRKPKTLEQKLIEKEFKDRILQNIQDLLTSQLNIAKGASYLYRIDETGEGSKKRKEHVLVTDQYEIKDALDALENGEKLDDYYYITTKTPDNRALDSLIDRVFGRATQQTDITSGGNPIPILGNVPINNGDTKNSGTQ